MKTSRRGFAALTLGAAAMAAVPGDAVFAAKGTRVTDEKETPTPAAHHASQWGPVLTWADPTASLLAGHRERMKAAAAIAPTGLTRADYLRLITGEIDFWKTKQDADGAIIDPYKHEEIQYSTPCFAHAASALIAYASRTDLIETAAKALDWAAFTLAERRAASKHEDFFAPTLAHAIRLLKPHVPAERSAKWENDIRRFDPYKTYRAGVGSGGNWNIVAASGEWQFQQMGLRAKSSRFVEDSFAGQGKVFGSPYGLYLEGPMPYDHFPRLWLGDLVAQGYDGPFHAEITELMRRAAITSLFMQSPWGELPAGGRSAHHQWNEAEQCVTYEAFGKIAQASGDSGLAAIYKRAAHLALRSMFRWVRPSGEMQIVKNWVDPAHGHAFEGYSSHSQYNLLPMAMLAIAYEHAETNESLAEIAAPCEVGGFVLDLPELHKVFANAAGAYIEIDTAGDHHYDATGLIRIHLPGVSPQLGPSDSILAHPVYRAPKTDPAPPTTGIGVAWQAKDGAWHCLGEQSKAEIVRVTVQREAETAERVAFHLRYEGEFNGIGAVEEHFAITPRRVEVTTTLPGYAGPVRRLVPVLVDDGRTVSTIAISGETLSVSQPGSVPTGSAPPGAQTFTAVGASTVTIPLERYPNHNGWARLMVAEYPAGAGEAGVILVIAPAAA